MDAVQRFMGARPDAVIGTSEDVTLSPEAERRGILPKWRLYWGQRIPGQEVDEIWLAQGEGSFYNRYREIEGQPYTPEVLEHQILTPEQVAYFTNLAEEYEAE